MLEAIGLTKPFCLRLPRLEAERHCDCVVLRPGFWVFASILPGLEHALLLKSVWCVSWGLVLALLAARLGLRKLRDDDPRSRVLVFEAPDAAFALLNLSGH